MAIFVFIARGRVPAPRIEPVPVRLVVAPAAPAETAPASAAEPPPPRDVVLPEPIPAVAAAPPAPAAPPIEALPSPPVPKPSAPADRPRHAAHGKPPRLTAAPPRSGLTVAPAVPAAPAPAPSGGSTMSARAIYRPMPPLPDELRRHPVQLVAMARFRVAADGSATVELLQATPDPALNRSLVATLRTWRFFPAIEDGRPIASTIDIRIPIAVQ